MKKNERLLFGILITVAIYFIAVVFGKYITPSNDFFPKSFGTSFLLLGLSILAIIILKKHVRYKISFPKFKTIFKPILLSILTAIIVNVVLTFATKIMGGKLEGMEKINEMTPLQVFLFIFIFASVSEEFLFRGFLLNILKPFSEKGIVIFKRKISIAVIISAVLFALAHLIIITSGANFTLVVRVLVFTFILASIAGYYQQKYKNNAYAIIVHVSGNFFALLISIFAHLL